MNEEYIKAFVENYKRKFADLHSVSVELETMLSFKDKEIADLKTKVEELEKKAAPVADPA